MIFSHDWINRYLEPGAAPEEIAPRLTAAGLAVEKSESRGRDVIFDVDVTTNRPDCMNHFGLAREAATLLGRELRGPSSDCREGETTTEDLVSVAVEDGRGCPRYVARVVRGVEVGPSPEWLRSSLEAIGQRSINNVVDITNYVLWELGQPIHAFDLAKIESGTLVIRRAREGESLVTLDEETRELSEDVLVIADGRRPVALAGIMGGYDSEVSSSTVDVLIESAHFDPGRVRAGAKALGMHTDASHRFERGADQGACRVAADRVAALIQEIAGGEVAAGAVDVTNPDCSFRLVGRLSLERASRFGGVELDASKVESWLSGIGFELESDGEGQWQVAIPTWRYYDMRPDPSQPTDAPQGAVFEADLFEEVLRLHGFDDIPATLPAVGGPDSGDSDEHERRQAIRSQLAASGYAEAITFAFHQEQKDRSYSAVNRSGDPLRLANPLSELYAVMRRSLIPGLVDAAEFNQRRGCQAVRLFEIGHVFPGGASAELEVVALVAGGQVDLPWDRAPEFDLFQLKGTVEGLADRFDVGLHFRSEKVTGFVPGTSSRLHLGDAEGPMIGSMGQIDAIDGPFPLFVAELETSAFEIGAVTRVQLPSRYPGVEMDLTLTHALDTSWAEMALAIRESRVADLAHFGLKDRYRGEGVPANAVNTTIYFLYNSDDSSLTREEVNERHEALRDELERRFGWKGEA